MWHIIPVGGDAIALTAEIYRYFNENASLKAYDAKYLFIDTDPASQEQYLEGIPDAYILQEAKQKDRTDAPQNWTTVADAFDKERDRLRRKIANHFVENSEPVRKINGILFVANIGGGTGGNGLIKLSDFFQIWHEEASRIPQQSDFADYLNPDVVPRYVLLIFPKTRKVGMIPQLKQNAWDAFQHLKQLQADGAVSGLVFFDRDTGLTTPAFDHRFRLILLNLILHENTIAAHDLLKSRLTVSHIRFDVKWRFFNGSPKVLNYEDNGKHFINENDHIKIRQTADLIDYAKVLRRSGLEIDSLVSLNPKKIKKIGPRILLDQACFEARYGKELTINKQSPLKSIYHNIIDNLNFIHDLKGYLPYETRNFESDLATETKKPEISIKYRLPSHTQKVLRTRLDRAEFPDIYLMSAQCVTENDFYLIEKERSYEYLRIRERGSENFLTLKVRQQQDNDTILTRQKYEIRFRNLQELIEILKHTSFKLKKVSKIAKQREIVLIDVKLSSFEKQSQFILNFDQVAKLGAFVEIKTYADTVRSRQTGEAIQALARLMGLTDDARETRTYLEMMLEA